MNELKDQVQEQADDQSLDQSLNIGSEVVLAAESEEFPTGIQKRIKIGTIGLLRQVRSKAAGAQGMRFSFAVGRPKMEVQMIQGEEYPPVDFPAIEAAYRDMFNLILVDGLSDAEYEAIDMNGLEELDKVLDRFL
ncbi:hypothetical protein [Saccharibacillus brassicae]|uniref:Uncharacterized protein n=1 Tax=Saccharibacillus brassicae TaxID=2583377 RepID=A0A4Y6V258_SACBS|nr:hypothetical protein [Saccharibacillus brassicae]QDH23454.1 hypothetical protein FFV09_22855 [Saccharibacillus brassicae]